MFKKGEIAIFVGSTNNIGCRGIKGIGSECEIASEEIWTYGDEPWYWCIFDGDPSPSGPNGAWCVYKSALRKPSHKPSTWEELEKATEWNPLKSHV